MKILLLYFFFFPTETKYQILQLMAMIDPARHPSYWENHEETLLDYPLPPIYQGILFDLNKKPSLNLQKIWDFKRWDSQNFVYYDSQASLNLDTLNGIAMLVDLIALKLNPQHAVQPQWSLAVKYVLPHFCQCYDLAPKRIKTIEKESVITYSYIRKKETNYCLWHYLHLIDAILAKEPLGGIRARPHSCTKKISKADIEAKLQVYQTWLQTQRQKNRQALISPYTKEDKYYEIVYSSDLPTLRIIPVYVERIAWTKERQSTARNLGNALLLYWSRPDLSPSWPLSDKKAAYGLKNAPILDGAQIWSQGYTLPWYSEPAIDWHNNSLRFYKNTKDFDYADLLKFERFISPLTSKGGRHKLTKVLQAILDAQWTDQVYGPVEQGRTNGVVSENLSVIKYACLYHGWQEGKTFSKITVLDLNGQVVEVLSEKVLATLANSYFYWAKQVKQLGSLEKARTLGLMPKGEYRIVVD